MLARLRHRSRLNHGVTLAVAAALLVAGMPNLVIHAHTDSGHYSDTASEQLHLDDHGAGGGHNVSTDGLHMHDFGVLGHSPALPSAMPVVSAFSSQFIAAECSGTLVRLFSTGPFRPPAV